MEFSCDEPRPRDAHGPLTWPTVMVTGHRPHRLSPDEAAWSRVVLHRVAWRLRSVYGARTGISGLALGADTWWALAVIGCGMRLHAYVPFEEQAAKWSAADRALWSELRGRADQETVVGGQCYDVRALHARNDAMLEATADDSGLVVAVHNGTPHGGTASAVQKAKDRGLPLLVVDPASRRITRVGW